MKLADLSAPITYNLTPQKNNKYYTVSTVLKSDIKTTNTTLSAQL
jgi:hypothetical protein